jgi:hypothetical protein
MTRIVFCATVAANVVNGKTIRMTSAFAQRLRQRLGGCDAVAATTDQLHLRLQADPHLGGCRKGAARGS